MDNAVETYNKWCRDNFGKPMAWEGIPVYMHDGIANYFLYGRPTGSFLMNLFGNDLMMLVRHADDTNINCLKWYVDMLFGYAPIGSYGSHEAVEKWMRQKGVSGWQAPDGQ